MRLNTLGPIRHYALLIATLLNIAPAGQASQDVTPLGDLVSRANLIVIGQVESVSEEPENPGSMLGDRLDRAEQRGFLVERFTRPGDECRRNAERRHAVVRAQDEFQRNDEVEGRCDVSLYNPPVYGEGRRWLSRLFVVPHCQPHIASTGTI